MTDTKQVTILTAMSTEDVARILGKIEADLIKISCDYLGGKTKLDALLDFVQDLSFDIEKGVNSK